MNLLKRAYSLKPSAEELEKTLSLFDNWTGDRDNLILSVGNYFWAVVRGMTADLWEELERDGVKQGVFSKGGYMNTREYIKEEGRQEGRQEERQKRDEIVLNMLKEKADVDFIRKVTRLSEEEIKQLKNRKR